MQEIAAVLGRKAGEQKPKVAVVRCNGNCEARKKTNYYDGVRSCKIEHNLYIGETGCSFGCLGGGDCERACTFDAIHINPETGLPEVDEEKCTACGACSQACKMDVEVFRTPNHSECIRCGDCVAACPRGAITRTFSLKTAQKTKETIT